MDAVTGNSRRARGFKQTAIIRRLNGSILISHTSQTGLDAG